jgi:HK97 family phage major capsid protein
MLEDSSIGVANLLATLTAEVIAQEEDRVGLIGDSGGTDPFDGIVNVTGINQVTMNPGNTSYDKVVAEDLLNMITATPTAALSGARFIMHRSVFDAIRKLKTTDGSYIFARPGLEAGTAGTIWGYPFSLSDTMPDTSTATQAGTDFVIFGNMQNLYMPIRRRMTSAVSTHIGFKEDQVWYRWTQRIGFSVPLPTTFTKLTTSAT